jgi:hypothetical protein
LPLHANEKDIYTFFAKEKGVGKIRDVRLIRDQRSGKSKGYVVAVAVMQNISQLDIPYLLTFLGSHM